MDFVHMYFLQTGLGWAAIGGILCAMFGGIGSAKGIRIAAAEAAGAIAEKPELFGRALILAALPGTQGFYAFIVMFWMLMRGGVLNNQVVISPVVGLAMLFIGIGVGIVEWRSAISQGEVSAASINLTAKRPEEGGHAILFPVLVETYAVLALLAGFLMILWLTPDGGIQYQPVETIFKVVAPVAK